MYRAVLCLAHLTYSTFACFQYLIAEMPRSTSLDVFPSKETDSLKSINHLPSLEKFDNVGRNSLSDVLSPVRDGKAPKLLVSGESILHWRCHLALGLAYFKILWLSRANFFFFFLGTTIKPDIPAM